MAIELFLKIGIYWGRAPTSGEVHYCTKLVKKWSRICDRTLNPVKEVYDVMRRNDRLPVTPKATRTPAAAVARPAAHWALVNEYYSARLVCYD